MSEHFNYLNNRYKITGVQFKNLLAFLSIMSNDYEYLYNLSPEYILEKFYMYIGNPINILNNNNYENGLHQLIKTKFINKYYERWGNIDELEFFINSSVTTNNFINDD